MRGSEVVNAVAETIGEVFSHNDFIVEHKTDIAKTIAHHEFANIFEYEFGVEETTRRGHADSCRRCGAMAATCR